MFHYFSLKCHFGKSTKVYIFEIALEVKLLTGKRVCNLLDICRNLRFEYNFDDVKGFDFLPSYLCLSYLDIYTLKNIYKENH